MDWKIIFQNQNLFWSGLGTTLCYTVITSVLGLVIGLIVAMLQLSTSRLLALGGRLFIEFFRNIPLLVWLLWSYYALPIFTGVGVSREMAGILALSL
jgi:polar amino acid transport system permease protein